MKKQSFILCMLAAVVMMSCDANKTDRDSADGNLGTDNTRTDSAAQGAVGSNDVVSDPAVQQFVEKALSGGMMEVELGNMASANAKNPRVKNFGSMMVTDHSQAGNELKQLAGNNSIQAPSTMLPEHQAHVDMMKGKTGAAFDKAYMDMMVKDHQEDIAQFEKASNELSTQSYKDFASKTLPVLRKHLDSAQVILKAL